MRRQVRGRSSSGQTLVLFALGLVALLTMVGLIIDGGNAYVQQRSTQNGMDAAAEAGAAQLARRLLGVAVDDAQVDAAVQGTATDNAVTRIERAVYVEYDPATGSVIELDPVGGGTIPTTANGVLAGGSRDFGTYFANVVGLSRFTASAEATAVTGFAETSGVGNLIPLTLPIDITQCQTGGGSTRLVLPLNADGDHAWPYGPNNRVALPLCLNGPGNVGWIDWDPPAGGAAEVGASIRNPDNPPIRTPKWYFVTETGEVTSLDDDMDTWEGKDIKIPIFHVEADDLDVDGDGDTTEALVIGTCHDTPTDDQLDLPDCPAGSEGFTGTQGWYYLVSFGVFHLEHSYIQGNHQNECNDPSLAITASPIGTNNPVDNCLIGYFKEAVVAGEFEVGAGGGGGSGTSDIIAIQLIR